jgi:hypothetical protein
VKSVAKESVPGDCFPKIKQITVPQKLKKKSSALVCSKNFLLLSHSENFQRAAIPARGVSVRYEFYFLIG